MFSFRPRILPTSFSLILSLFACLSVFAQSGVSTLNGDFSAVTVSGARIIALDLDGKELLISDDNGASFQSQLIMEDAYHDLAAVGATVVAVGIDGWILRSTDAGSTWSSATAASLANGLNSVAGRTDGSNPNQWLAVGDDGFDGAIFRSTDDAANWSQVAVVLDDIVLSDVIWTGNRWLACGRDNSFDSFDSFETGIVYSSTDGLNWSASTVPVSRPLLAMAHDSSGVVLAVGEQGELLRSTDDGLTFVALSYSGFSGDWAAVTYLNGSFFVGGDEKSILEVVGTTASTSVPAASSANSVQQLVVVGSSLFAVGAFEGVIERTVPLDLILTIEGTQDYRLTITETLAAKTYYLETSVDLENWDIVENSSRLGTGSATFYDVPENGTKRFWRANEF